MTYRVPVGGSADGVSTSGRVGVLGVEPAPEEDAVLDDLRVEMAFRVEDRVNTTEPRDHQREMLRLR